MKILHLFDDLMNLYGEYANILVLERCLTELGHTVELRKTKAGEALSFSQYDLIFMGAGTERKQKLALEAHRPYAGDLKAAYEAGKILLFTGNSFPLLGKRITDSNGKVYEGLELFPFESTEGSRRILGDCLGSCDLTTEPVVGFMNKCSKITGVHTPLFHLSMGFGNDTDKGPEGLWEKNCFATHMTGPLLTKNPALLRHLLTLLTASPVTTLPLPHLEQAYEVTRKALEERKT